MNQYRHQNEEGAAPLKVILAFVLLVILVGAAYQVRKTHPEPAFVPSETSFNG